MIHSDARVQKAAQGGAAGVRAAANCRVVLFAATALALAGSVALTAAGPAAAEPRLLALLRFMAALKAAGALAALVLVDWRLRMRASPALALGYVAAVALMAAAPAPIWRMSHVMAAGVSFHAGLLLLLCLGYADRGIAARLLPALPSGRARTGTPT